MALDYEERGEETIASIEAGFLMLAYASEDKAGEILSKYVLSDGYNQDVIIENIDEGFDAIGENDHDAFFEGIDDPREEDLFNPEFIEGYEHGSNPAIDFKKPFVCNDVFEIRSNNPQTRLREGVYLVDQNENPIYLADLMPAAQFEKYLVGKDPNGEFDLGDLIDVRNTDMEKVLKGRLVNSELVEEGLREIVEGRTHTSIDIMKGSEVNFRLSFYVGE